MIIDMREMHPWALQYGTRLYSVLVVLKARNEEGAVRLVAHLQPNSHEGRPSHRIEPEGGARAVVDLLDRVLEHAAVEEEPIAAGQP